MDKWIRERLKNCLDFEVPDDMIKYILSMKSSTEFDEYFETLLNSECEDHRSFMTDCKQRLFSKPLHNKRSPQPNNNQQQKQAKSVQNTVQNKQNQNTLALDGKFGKQQQQQQSQGAKKKSKYVNLYTSDGSVSGEVIMLKGRRLCDCQASQHKLINNCLGCGRIVCEQEGSGPCLFCGDIVCTNEEMQIMKGDSKKGQNLLKSLKEKGGGESLKKALEQRDRLLEYDRNSEKRTTVIDDELDYFEENSVWLSESERAKFEQLKQEMHEKKHESRAKRKIKIDFAGREVEDDPPITADFENRVLKEIAQAKAAAGDKNNWSNRKNTQKITPDTCGTDPNMDDEHRPVYKLTAEGKAFAADGSINKGLGECTYNRVQDKELLEMQDMRHCLSMHQPWASLLVAGIKKHEGRVWYSEHRGRLWIASTVKDPHPEEIEELKNFYKTHYNDPSITFPEHYPTGCLLGCVRVDDCLAQEEYREIYPDGESESPYVFVCSNPQQLPVVFPVKGQHKIYQIDPKIHNAACKTLLRLKNTKN
ncbi:activating signal cointegrator 1 [Bactrocera neohumeralis]|uniref:activating signal cointegrator 1 n=1 Tax=Bactrocera neohumeralis TaxID=98809 RepID=UPI0021668D27|nr:activating signal cointegrator 1 [Bactrocera neohumeralis]